MCVCMCVLMRVNAYHGVMFVCVCVCVCVRECNPIWGRLAVRGRWSLESLHWRTDS